MAKDKSHSTDWNKIGKGPLDLWSVHQRYDDEKMQRYDDCGQ